VCGKLKYLNPYLIFLKSKLNLPPSMAASYLYKYGKLFLGRRCLQVFLMKKGEGGGKGTESRKITGTVVPF